MKRGGVLLLIAATLTAGCVGQSRTPRDVYDRLLTARAEPSKVVATELAFARAAQEEGQWTAFAEYSTDDAIMFVPGVVNARSWLKGRANPPKAVTWQPHDVWLSCDGSLAVTRGAWQRADGTVGYFTTAWRRQKDGAYKWIMDQGDGLKEPLVAPEFVRSEVAQCGAPPPMPLITPLAPGYTRQGSASLDGTLEWRMAVSADAAERMLTLHIMRDGRMTPVLDLKVRAAQ